VAEPQALIQVRQVLQELEQRLSNVKPDTITFSGSGEPTLHPQIDEVIAFIKDRTAVQTAVLTNGSLLWRHDVRERVSGAHIVMPTLTTAYEETFKLIHRPHPTLHVARIIAGLKDFRKMYSGKLLLEVILLAGYNDNPRELEALRRVIQEIEPDRIQLNTVVRPPADTKAVALDRASLLAIKAFFGPSAEIIADSSQVRAEPIVDSLVETILDMAKRRPVRARDVAGALNTPLAEVEGIMKGLLIKGTLEQREFAGDAYYFEKERGQGVD
jgi:wyosine [tRNA(Phe)-imidazoG37] synthetase (radical SAM superfamily)